MCIRDRFCLEGNVRYASILGYVGAGGLGLIMNEKIGWREYDSLGMIPVSYTHLAENGDADRRDDKADDRRQGILPRHLAEMDGEDQVSGPEKHSEQCSGNKNFLPEC